MVSSIIKYFLKLCSLQLDMLMKFACLFSVVYCLLCVVYCLLSEHVNIVQSAARKHCPLLSPSSQNSTVSCSQTSRKQVLANRNESLQFPEHAARVMRTACISECVPCTQARRGGGHVTMNYSHSAPAPYSQCVLQTCTHPHRLTIVFV